VTWNILTKIDAPQIKVLAEREGITIGDAKGTVWWLMMAISNLKKQPLVTRLKTN
jgi:hypothetical protein